MHQTQHDSSDAPRDSQARLDENPAAEHCREALKDSEQRLRLALDGARMGTWDWDTHKHTAVWNAREYEVLGLPLGDGCEPNEAFLNRVHPEDLGRLKDNLAELFKQGSEWQIEFRVIHPNGEVRWLAAAARLYRDDNGLPVRLLGVNYDITERKRAEEARLASEKRLAEDLVAMTKLQEVGTLFIHGGNLTDVLSKIVDAAMVISGSDFGDIELVDPASAELRLAVQRGLPQWWAGYFQGAASEHGKASAAPERGERVIVHDIEGSPESGFVCALEMQRQAGVRAVLSIPLVSRSGRLLGMCTSYYKTPHQPHARTLQLLDLLARQTADILERAQIEKTQRESDQLFRAAFSHAVIGFAIGTPDGRILNANPAYCALTGYSLDELKKMRIWELIHPEDFSENKKLHVLLQSGELPNFVIENRYVRKDGAVVSVRKSISISRDDAGALGKVYILVEDVTERKHAEEALRASRARLEVALASMTDMVIISDAQGHLLEFNDAFATFHRFKNKQECQRTLAAYPQLLDVSLPDGTPVPFESWAIPRALRGESCANIEYCLRRKDTGETWLGSFGYAPIRDHGGSIIGAIVTGRDITDYKRATEAAARANVLAEANRQKDEFLAILGHELRNPLAPIRNAVAVMKRFPAAPVFQRSCEMIDRQVTHLARLLDDLLDISRIERGKISLRKTEFELSPIIQAAIEDHRPLFDSNGVMLSFTAPPAPLHAYGDSARIGQIVSNLLINANKFTDRGGRVAIELTSEEGRWAVITVSDTGIGMDAETIASIFKPFAQAAQSFERSQGGLGLGLALVKGLAELHGGSVRCSSQGVGHGSQFRVALPILTQFPSESSRPQPAESPACSPQRMLIIEDNEDAAESLKMLLELCGHEVAVAHSGQEGMEKARSFDPDVVLCDVGLPAGMDGYAVAQAMRADSALRRAFLIAMTGYGQDEDRRKAKEAGFDVHLVKPADPKTLEQLLAQRSRRTG